MAFVRASSISQFRRKQLDSAGPRIPALPPARVHPTNSLAGSAAAEGGVKTRAKPKSKSPAQFTVLILNDDFTPMDFVVHVLQKFFQKEYNEAMRIMMQVHHQGAGVAGTFTYEIAETKAHQVNQYARQNQHPLKCALEEA